MILFLVVEIVFLSLSGLAGFSAYKNCAAGNMVNAGVMTIGAFVYIFTCILLFISRFIDHKIESIRTEVSEKGIEIVGDHW